MDRDQRREPGRNGTIEWRLVRLEEHHKEMEQKVDRLIWAFVSFALAIATAAMVFALTTFSQGGGVG